MTHLLPNLEISCTSRPEARAWCLDSNSWLPSWARCCGAPPRGLSDGPELDSSPVTRSERMRNRSETRGIEGVSMRCDSCGTGVVQSNKVLRMRVRLQSYIIFFPFKDRSKASIWFRRHKLMSCATRFFYFLKNDIFFYLATGYIRYFKNEKLTF